MTQATKAVGIGVLLAGLALGLGACRENEQNRPLHLEKGTYSGQPDTELTEDQRRALQQRGQLQKF